MANAIAKTAVANLATVSRRVRLPVYPPWGIAEMDGKNCERVAKNERAMNCSNDFIV